MLHHKDIHNIDELQSLLRLKEKTIDLLVDYMSFFDFRSITSRFDTVKKKGYSFSNLLSVLVVMPFLHMASLRALLISGISYLSEAKKDAYYRLKNNPNINWRNVLYGFSKKYREIILAKAEGGDTQPRCFVIDDSVLEKAGRKIERVGRLWDHVTHRSVLGFKLLCLGYYDGKSFIPLDFCLHREKGSNAKKPYGLSKKELNQQYGKQRCCKSPSSKRANFLPFLSYYSELFSVY